SEKPGGAGIKEAFWRANAVLPHRFYLDHDGVLWWRGDLPALRQDSYSLSGVRAELGDILISGSTDELARVLGRLAEDMRRLALSRSAVRGVALELFTIVQEYFDRNDLPVQSLLPHSFRTYEQLAHMETLREVTGWMRTLQDDLTAFLCRENEKGYPKIIGTVLDWIAAHYRESASLQEAAQVVNLNPSYLSTLLKKYTGKSYTELLTEYRIERAKELLLMTGEKVYRVGQMVGYEDKYYFNRIFKRVTGMSPGEFKNQRREV
ncbi:MAG: helix-turn-helix domain-containing protein, partial [Butyricicoccus sp.]